MNLVEKLAQGLKLPQGSDEAAVFGALMKRDSEGRAAVETLSAVTSELGKHGLKLDGKSLVRVEPLKLDLTANAGDDPEKVELKRRVLEAEKRDGLAALSANKEFVKKLAADMKLPPALMSTVEEVLNVKGELETLTLSKDGASFELRKTADLPGKLKQVFSALSSFKGVKFPTPEAGAESLSDQEKASKEREKLAKELKERQEGKEELAKK